MHLLSIECTDWPKLYMTCLNLMTQPPGNANFRLALLLFICCSSTVFFDVVACVESKCMIKAKHILPKCKFVIIALEKNSNHVEVLTHFFPCNVNVSTCQQDMFYYVHDHNSTLLVIFDFVPWYIKILMWCNISWGWLWKLIYTCCYFLIDLISNCIYDKLLYGLLN